MSQMERYLTNSSLPRDGQISTAYYVQRLGAGVSNSFSLGVTSASWLPSNTPPKNLLETTKSKTNTVKLKDTKINVQKSTAFLYTDRGKFKQFILLLQQKE